MAGSPETGTASEDIPLARQLAHDARSPISALVVLSSSLKEQLADHPGDLAGYHLDLLHNAALSLDALMDDLSDLGRTGELVDPGTQSPFSVDGVLRDLRNLLLPMAELRDVPVQVRSEGPDHRTGHPAALRRTLLGLASLPLRMGGDRPVEVAAVSSGETTVAFSVRTESPGPEPEVLTAIEGVVREGRPRNRACFAHLGLELSLRLLHLMDSRLDWEAEGAEGVRFSFELDLPPSDASA